MVRERHSLYGGARGPAAYTQAWKVLCRTTHPVSKEPGCTEKLKVPDTIRLGEGGAVPEHRSETAAR